MQKFHANHKTGNERAATFSYSISKTTSGRRFAISKTGLFIWAPPLSEEGDVVCTFEGIDEPFLVRHVDGDDWQLVGNCYVNNLLSLRNTMGAAFQRIVIV